MKADLAFWNDEVQESPAKKMDWNYFVNEVSRVFTLSKKEQKEFKNSVTAKIIATIPFAANCNMPERTATAHLCLYMAEKRGFQEYCAHLPDDDKTLLTRLDFISTFDGGDQQILEHGMYILALIMLEGYKCSATKDTFKNIYNPIASGAWNYEEKKNEILNILKKTKNEELDDLAEEVSASSRGW